MSNRKPTAVKKAQGTSKKCRENKNEPKFEIVDKMPQPPKDFDEYALKLWKAADEAVKNSVIQYPDLTAFEIVCRDYSRYMILEKHFKENYLTKIEGKQGGRSAAAQDFNSVIGRLVEGLSNFGFTPLGRSKLGITTKKETNPDKEKMKELMGA